MNRKKKQGDLFQFKGGDGDETPAKKIKGRKESQKEYESKRSQKFVPNWTNIFPGVLYNEEKDIMHCRFCVAWKESGSADTTSSFVKEEGCGSNRIDSLRSHWTSACHAKCVKLENVRIARENANVHQGPIDFALRRLNEENQEILLKLFNTVYYILKEELPFVCLPSLVRLQKKNGSDLRKLLSYTSDQACRR